MATGVDSSPPPYPETERVAGGIALDFPLTDTLSFSSPSRVPTRLRRRLLEEAKTPSSVEEIEAKLRLADLRRQQFYEKLSSKARGKPRSPSRYSSQDEDLAQRLEAKLQAAEQKRLSILAKAQMRLAKLDELRQAAKTGVEIRLKRERERLCTKVELRVQQAEANRMLILKACKQRRATLKERTSLLMSRRIARECKYKDSVRAAIHQKRLAAEKKRIGLLDEEKKRACTRVLQVKKVAKSISHQHEVQRRRMRDQLEDRLQRAKRQRAEHLRQRATQHNSVQLNRNRMHKHADFLSRKLARCWRQFLRSRKTTFDLAKDYDALKIDESLAKSMPFEQLACLIESTATLQTVKVLLDRLESRLRFSRAVVVGSNPPGLDNIEHLLKRVATPTKKPTPRSSTRSREAKKAGPSIKAPVSQPKSSRYPVRVVLCAYMILGHPDAVLSGQGERESALAKSAEELIQEFELLIRIILDGPTQVYDEEFASMPKCYTFRSQLAAFDKAWCSYLNCFVVWKVKDAQLLEEELVRAACQLELSMIEKCKLTPSGENETLTHDMKAIQKQVIDDQKLLREKVRHLSGYAGIEHMECALSEARSKYFQAKENGSPVGSSITHFLSISTQISPTGTSSTATSGDRDNVIERAERPSRVVRSLFREDDTSSPKESSSSESGFGHFAGTWSSCVEKLTENEHIVNEFIHERRASVDRLGVTNDNQNSIKEKIRNIMEEAFWDGVLESVKQVEPDYDQVVQLVREVRDEISEMAPENWKQEIVDAIDLDILTQLLKSGNLNVAYLGKILDFALGTLRKLSSAAQEDELKVTHQKLLKELTETCQTRDDSKFSHATAMIKGLRFVLEQIQALKQEISKAHIRMMEPLLKGPAGLEYLKKAFANRYGSHTYACSSSLPLTRQWLSSVRNCKDEEWEEHNSSLSAMMSCGSSCQVFIPSTTLRTGGSFPVKANGNGMSASTALNTTGSEQPEPGCKGEKVDLLVRLGLLQLVSAISGLKPEALPETLLVNLHRLRAVQAQFQKIIVISTSILVCRQALLMEKAMASSEDTEGIVSKCTKQLLEALDCVDDVGIEEIVNVISGFLCNGTELGGTGKIQSRKVVMGRMLAKSLQAGDPVFEKVSRAVYLSARGVVLGGSGHWGKKLAEMSLRQIGAIMLTERVVQAAEVLVVVATMSVAVHGPWYMNLIDNM